MSNQLVSAGGFIPSYDLAGIQNAGELLFKSGYFSDAKSVAQAVVKVMAGAELGIPPFAAMQGIHIIQGKPCLSAGVMAGKVKASGRYDFRVLTMTDDLVEIAFFERGVEIGRSSFSRADAIKAGTQNLGKFPRNMLYARAMSNGVKWHCPDIFLGPIYTPEEMGATVNEVTGEVIEGTFRTPVQQPVYEDPPPYYSEENPRPAPTPAPKREDGSHMSTTDQAVANGHLHDDAMTPACGKHIGSMLGWMRNRGLDADDRELAIYICNRAAGRGTDDAPWWASRKEICEEEWRQIMKVLPRTDQGIVDGWIDDYVLESEAGAEHDDDPTDTLLDVPAAATGPRFGDD